jgi:hypothetical protein
MDQKKLPFTAFTFMHRAGQAETHNWQTLHLSFWNSTRISGRTT